MDDRPSRASGSNVDAGISALAAAVNLAASLVAFYAAVRFVVWTWVP
jgi:hypothetical protein